MGACAGLVKELLRHLLVTWEPLLVHSLVNGEGMHRTVLSPRGEVQWRWWIGSGV